MRHPKPHHKAARFHKKRRERYAPYALPMDVIRLKRQALMQSRHPYGDAA